MNRPFQKKSNGKGRLALFPPSQHDRADGNMGKKALDVPDVSYSEMEERSERKTADETKRKAVGDPHDFGKPIAQSSPVQDHKHSNSDTTRRCFILEDFIVKGSRSGKKKGTGAQGQMLQPSGSRESKSRKRINPTRLGTEESKGLYSCASVMEYRYLQQSSQSPGMSLLHINFIFLLDLIYFYSALQNVLILVVYEFYFFLILRWQ